METSESARNAIGALTAANIAFQGSHYEHGFAQLDAAEKHVGELRMLAEENKQAEEAAHHE